MMSRLLGFLLFIGALSSCTIGVAEARDVRLALLVGNQRGWKGDPDLRYIIKGDLRPMERTLRRAGFKIHAVLANQPPQALRRAFQQIIRRLNQKPKVTTFFFYYTGHADKKYFHMGRRSQTPFSYREFVQYLKKIKVKRRFGALDACFSGEVIRQFGTLSRYRSLLSKGALQKGIMRKLKRRDLGKYLPKSGEQVRGLQLLSSSRHLSFESRKLKGSVFTHYFLKGIKGDADLNQDGQISFNELFLYIKPKVKAYTGQSPQQWLFRVGGDVYAFVPVYQSQLHVGASTIGRLQIQIGNFLWSYRKQRKKKVRLAVVSGAGYVRMKRRKRCYQQSLVFPKGGTVKLSTNGWELVECRPSELVGKGKVAIQGYSLPFNPLESKQFLIQSGAWYTSGAFAKQGDLSGGLLLGFRWKYTAFLLGLWGTSIRFTEKQYTQLGIDLRFEAGYRHHWRKFDLFVGAQFTLSTVLQDINTESRPGWLLIAGVTLSPTYWVTESLGLAFIADFGAAPLFTEPKVLFVGSLRFGLRIPF